MAGYRAKGGRWRGEKGPTLDPERQVTYLESRGIGFERMDRKEAAAYLRDVGGFMRTAAYKSLFAKERDGHGITRYVGLDFSQLVDLCEIDHDLRHVFLPIALDVEQAAKLALLYQADRQGENPYDLVGDYFVSLSGGRRARLEAELEDRRGDADVYAGDLIDKYVGDMPVWVIAEILDFGDFLELWRFCAERWRSDDLVQERYLLKDVKELRNACAHGSCVLNGIGAGQTRYPAPDLLVRAVSATRVGTTADQDRWLNNPRTLEMLATLWCSHELVRSDDRRAEARLGLEALAARCRQHADWYRDNEPLTSCYRYFSGIVAAWL